MTTQALKLNNWEQKLTILLGVFLVVLCFLYIYFVNSTILQISLRNHNQEEAFAVQTEITNLVSEYMALVRQIDMSYAESLGFIDASNLVSFIERDTAGLTLTLGINEL